MRAKRGNSMFSFLMGNLSIGIARTTQQQSPHKDAWILERGLVLESARGEM